MKTMSDHILDIVQNSISAKATLIEIMVEENKKNNLCLLRIVDNGCGMDKQTVNQAISPFFTSRNTRKVGLGLSLLKQNAEMANGTFRILSAVGKGTEVIAEFELRHIDKPPLGDIWNTLYLIILGNENIEFNYYHKTEKGKFEFKSKEIKEMLNGVSLANKEIREAIIELIKNNLKGIEL